jgi:hypothetical protein
MEKKSPLKYPPLRQAGQWLGEETLRLGDEIVEVFIAPIAVTALAVFDWCGSYFHLQRSPGLFIAMAVVLWVYAFVRTIWLRRRLRNSKLGRQGEIVVGQHLESLREKGFKVFHDVPCTRGNIDHILLGTRGVFAIETKTWSQPTNAPKPTITYDGKMMRFGGIETSEPLAQATAEACFLHDLIHRKTGMTPFVRAVVFCPEWEIKEHPHGVTVWVVNEKMLPAFLEHENAKIEPKDIGILEACLSDYIRSATNHS